MKSPNLELLNLSIFFSLVKLVFRVWASVSDWDWQTDDHNQWARCTKRTAIKPGFQTISKQQAAHAHAIFVTRLTQSQARVCQNQASEAKRALVAGCEIILSWCETKTFHPIRTCASHHLWSPFPCIFCWGQKVLVFSPNRLHFFQISIRFESNPHAFISLLPNCSSLSHSFIKDLHPARMSYARQVVGFS